MKIITKVRSIEVKTLHNTAIVILANKGSRNYKQDYPEALGEAEDKIANDYGVDLADARNVLIHQYHTRPFDQVGR